MTGLRILRVVLALEGLVMSWRTFRQTRDLEIRREHGDQSLKGAVALTPQSRLFGVPNGLTASGYFAIMALLSASGLVDSRRLRPLGLTLAFVSTSISGYLLYQLLFVLKKNCPVCMRAHGLNLLLTLTLLPTAPTRLGRHS